MQVKTITRIFDFANDASEYVFPSVAGNWKFGALLPNANVLWSSKFRWKEKEIIPRIRNKMVESEFLFM